MSANTVHSALVRTSNFVGDTMGKVGSLVFSNGVREIFAYTALGAITGSFLPLGKSKGMFNGFVQGVFYSQVSHPLEKYFRKERPDSVQFTKNGKRFLETLGLVAKLAIPFFISEFYGEKSMRYLSEKCTGRVSHALTPSSAPYGILSSFIITVVPDLIVISLKRFS